jgi:hypothetical protein
MPSPNIPDHDPRWDKRTIEEWKAVWSDVEWAANIRAGLHVPALWRLFTYKNRWYSLNDEMYDQPMLVLGSRGNDVKNPLLAELRELEDTVLRIEKEFGMTLRSASLINLDLGQGELNWAQLQEKNKRNALAGPRQNKKALPVTSIEVLE